MKRWAICKIGDYEGTGETVPKFNVYGANSRIWTKPGFAWCMGQIALADLTAISADPDVFILPDGTMDLALSSFPAATRTNMQNKLVAAGFDFSGVHLTWTVRELLTYLAGQIQPNTNVESGDVADQTS